MQLILIACCLFAPKDANEFEAVLQAGGHEATSIPVTRVPSEEFTAFARGELASELSGSVSIRSTILVRKNGTRYTIRGRDNKEYAIDTSKIDIRPLEREGRYTRKIDGRQITFEYRNGERRISERGCEYSVLLKTPKHIETQSDGSSPLAIQQEIASAIASTPQQAYNDMCNNMEKGRLGRVYDSFSKESQAALDAHLKTLLDLAASSAAAPFEELAGGAGAKDNSAYQSLKGLAGKELFVKMFTGERARKKPVAFGEVVSSKVTGDTATLRIRRDGREEHIQMLKEEGRWKLHMR